MKKILYLTIIILVLPIIIMKINKPKNIVLKEKKYSFEKNTLVRVKREELNRIDTIPLEKYLIGVLAGEMPTSYDIEALKAQAVAARTYTLKKMETNKEYQYDVVDNTNDQMYLDDEYLKQLWQESYDKNIKKIKQAINETTGEYLSYDNQIIKAFFFSTSSGATENCKDVFGENLPYLVSVSSIWDESSPSYSGEKIFSKKEFLELLNIPYSEKININIEKNETNSIKNIEINDVKIKGTDFRYKLKLKSTNIEIEENNNDIIIKTKGYGHGVGMSQYGAKELAQQGYKYNEILKYYYKGTEIKKI